MACQQLAFEIKRQRRRRSWSQAQLAEVADVSLRTIQRVERDGQCSPETLLAMAAAFDVDVESFTRLLASPAESEAEASLLAGWPRLMRRLSDSSVVKGSLGITAALTSLMALLIAVHNLLAPQNPAGLLLFRLTLCAFVLTVGVLTGYRLFRQANLTLDVLLLAGGAGLLVLGAAAGVWAYHTGYVTGDFEYWLMMFDLLLITHGGLLLLTSGLGRRVQI